MLASLLKYVNQSKIYMFFFQARKSPWHFECFPRAGWSHILINYKTSKKYSLFYLFYKWWIFFFFCMRNEISKKLLRLLFKTKFLKWHQLQYPSVKVFFLPILFKVRGKNAVYLSYDSSIIFIEKNYLLFVFLKVLLLIDDPDCIVLNC